jgi:hypothetical protein
VEVLSSPFYKGDRKNTRRYIVSCKADAFITRFCNRLAIETESPISFVLNGLDFLENGERKFFERYKSIEMGAQIGAPISEAEFLALEKEVSTRYDDLLDSYSDLYNRYLKSKDVFEKYKLLYLIADKEAKTALVLRTIRNMLHHIALDPKNTDQCKKAADLFGKVQAAKEILAEVFRVRISEVDEMILNRYDDVRHEENSSVDGEMWPREFQLEW